MWQNPKWVGFWVFWVSMKAVFGLIRKFWVLKLTLYFYSTMTFNKSNLCLRTKSLQGWCLVGLFCFKCFLLLLCLLCISCHYVFHLMWTCHSILFCVKFPFVHCFIASCNLFPGLSVSCGREFYFHAIPSQVHVYIQFMSILGNILHLGSELWLNFSGSIVIFVVSKNTQSHSHRYQISFFHS